MKKQKYYYHGEQQPPKQKQNTGNIYENNKKVLKKHYPQFYDRVIHAPDNINYQLQPTKTKLKHYTYGILTPTCMIRTIQFTAAKLTYSHSGYIIAAWRYS